MFFMIFQLIPFVLLSPTICGFHDQKVSPLPGRFRHYMITTEHWYMPLLKLAQKCRIVFSLTWVYLEIWNQEIFLDISFQERHTGQRRWHNKTF